MRKSLALAAVAALGLTGAASASDSLTMDFDGVTYEALQFEMQFAAGDLIGDLTSIDADFVLDGATGGTWADDLTVLVVDGDSVGDDPYSVQVGGFSDLGADEYSAWGEGASGTPGTPVNTTIDLASPVDVSDQSVWLGFGWDTDPSLNSGTWTGSITLNGVRLVPAPGALALLGVAGLVGTRRRRA